MQSIKSRVDNSGDYAKMAVDFVVVLVFNEVVVYFIRIFFVGSNN